MRNDCDREKNPEGKNKITKIASKLIIFNEFPLLMYPEVQPQIQMRKISKASYSQQLLMSDNPQILVYDDEIFILIIYIEIRMLRAFKKTLPLTMRKFHLRILNFGE